MENYNISTTRIVLGDLDNAQFVNTIILLTKKVIYNAMKKEQHLLNVKNETKKFYFEEKYRLYLKGKGNFFEKQYSLLSNIYTRDIDSTLTLYIQVFILALSGPNNFVRCFLTCVRK